MRAAVVDRYGPPETVRIAEVPQPQPRADEVLVRVRAAAVTAGDARIRAARFPAGFAPFARLAFGLTGPRRGILGGTFSGEVAAVGARAGDWAPGAEVAGMTGTRMGTHAEYVAVPAARLARKPAEVSHEQAAGVLFGGTTALWFLSGPLGDCASGGGEGRSVLVNGASGAIGTNAVQLARRAGARVTAVTSAPNARLVGELGADRVIDYARTPVADLPDRFDVVLDAVGNLTLASGRRLLADDGVLLLPAAGLAQLLRSRGNVKAGSSPERAADFAALLALVAAGDLVVVIDNVLDLAEIVAAYRRTDSGHKVGNLIVRP